MKKTSLFFFVMFVSVVCLSAQSSFVATGGEATGTGGTVSSSVGQIAVQTNGNGSTTISEGVQQPYEISVVGIDEHPEITLNAILFPNPTLGNLQLTISNEQFRGEVKAYDSNGKYLFDKKIEDETTEFDLTKYAPGTYYLRVMNGKNVLKTFKVVKMGR